MQAAEQGSMTSAARRLLPDRPEEERLRRLDLACWHVQDALDGVERPKPRVTHGARVAFYVVLWLVPFMPTVTRLFMILTVFERPLWCLQAQQRLDAYMCDPEDDTRDLYPSFELPLLPQSLNLVAELLFMAPLALHVGALLFAHGSAAFPDATELMCVAFVTLTAIDIIYAYSTPVTWWRMAPYLRAGLHVLHTRSQRMQFAVLWRAARCFYAVAFLLIIFILYCGWLATVLFPKAISTEGKEIMPTVTEATWQLLILLTTANYPDVMMPAYTDHRGAFFFFFLFICIGVFFLMNYTLASIYDAWKTQDRLHQQEALESRQRSLAAAFAQLDWEGKGELDRDQILRLLERLPRAASFRHNVWLSGDDEESAAAAAAAEGDGPPMVAKHASSRLTSLFAPSVAAVHIQRALAFAVLDAGGDEVIQPEEFSHLITVLHLQFRRVDERSVIQLLSPCVDSRLTQFLARYLNTPAFEYFIDGVLVLSAAALAFDTRMLRNGGQDGLSPMQVGFTLLFSFEATMKTLLLPYRELLSSPRHCFDIAVTLLSLVILTIVYLPNGFDSGSAVRAVLSLRLLRLARLLLRVPPFRKVIGTFVSLLPTAMELLGACAVVMYLFSVLGVQLFGGAITTDDSGAIISKGQAQRLADSDFGQSGYYPNNFNDLPSGFVTLFELLVVNNWQVIASGYSAVFGNMSRWFFVLFYAVGVVVMLNVIIAFVLDSYEAFEAARESGLDANDDGFLDDCMLFGDAVRFDASHITGTYTGVRGIFEVTLKDVPLHNRGAWRGLLLRLFATHGENRGTGHTSSFNESREQRVASCRESAAELLRPTVDAMNDPVVAAEVRRRRSQHRLIRTASTST